MFQEYPKAVYPTSGHPVVVESAEHEAAVLILPAQMSEAIANRQEELAEVEASSEPVKRRPGRPRRT